MRVIEQILELARWAPSGDNTQPWRFEIIDDAHGVVHGFDTRDHCVYDLDGHASQLALGCLLETIELAASAHGIRVEILRRDASPETTPTFDVRLHADPSVSPAPLLPFITKRSVQRRPMQTRPLSLAEKRALEQAVAGQYKVTWKESRRDRWQSARLMFANAEIRLTMPEAYLVHRSIIEWNAQYSESMVPDQAVGLDTPTLKLMRWAMQSWNRVDILNRYFMGTLAPRLQLDLIPGWACAAHFAIVAKQPPTTPDDYIAGGRAVQRFWLTATQLGLQLQPEMTPVIFSRYIREGRDFTDSPKPRQLARDLAARFDQYCGQDQAKNVVFLGRTGAGKPAHARSTRLPLAALLRPR
ncbi:MAG: nitroreductase family protein [Gammaproteobacteria bacterium]|nr:nitroreductase family protein [Gammaproteobacteria bacterium]